jgi:hypothetical protein
MVLEMNVGNIVSKFGPGDRTRTSVRAICRRPLTFDVTASYRHPVLDSDAVQYDANQ